MVAPCLFWNETSGLLELLQPANSPHVDFPPFVEEAKLALEHFLAFPATHRQCQLPK